MKTLKYIFYGIAAAFIIWIAGSYIDVISDNITAAPKHSNINAFVLLYDFLEDGKQ